MLAKESPASPSIHRSMQFLALVRRRMDAFTAEQFAPHMEPEAEQARTLYAQGHLRAAYSRGDIPGAVLLLEAADAEDANRVVGTLPLVKLGMLEVTMLPLNPYRGFGPRA